MVGHSRRSGKRRPQRRPKDINRSAPAAGGGSGGYWLYGDHAVSAAIANPARRILRLLGTNETLARLAASEPSLRQRSLEPEPVDRAVLDGLMPDAVHQGLALLVHPLDPPAIEDILSAAGQAAVIVALDKVTDPRNVGAILRSAAAFGADAMIVPADGMPGESGALAKAASGALDRLPMIPVINLARAMDLAKEAGFWCHGFAEEGAELLGEAALDGRRMLVMGAEGTGLRRLTRERCDSLLRVPTGAGFGTLNVANAAAVALYEWRRQNPGGTSAPAGS